MKNIGYFNPLYNILKQSNNFYDCSSWSGACVWLRKCNSGDIPDSKNTWWMITITCD